MTAIAKKAEYYVYITPPVYQRKRTVDCEKTALDVLKDYKKYGKISKETYKNAKESVLAAPNDDAISNIMCRLRHSINW